MSMSSDRFSFEEPAGSAAPRHKHKAVAIQALLFTPLAVVAAVGVIYAALQIADGETGHFVMLVVAGILFVVFAFQALHYLKDMRSHPLESEGEVSKKWTKSNLFFFFVPSYYIAVKGSIYSITRHQYRGLLEEDIVRIQHYPYSLTVVYVERYDVVEKKFVPAEPDAAPY